MWRVRCNQAKCSSIETGGTLSLRMAIHCSSNASQDVVVTRSTGGWRPDKSSSRKPESQFTFTHADPSWTARSSLTTGKGVKNGRLNRVRACSLGTFFADRAAGRRCWAGWSGALARGARPAAALARANGGLHQPTRPDANGWTRPSAVLSSGLQARYAQTRIGPRRSPACGFPVCAAQPLF